jgi:acyl carrier protein
VESRNLIRQFILSNFYVADPTALQDRSSLLDNGVVDSTGVLEIITFLEANFGITVEDDEMLPENLDSVDNLVRFLSNKQAGPSCAASLA